jgi:hypothetical protein
MRSTRALAALTAAAVVAPAATAGAADPDTRAATEDVAPAALTPDFAGETTLRRQMHRHALRQQRREAHRRLVARYERAARRAADRWSDRRLRAKIRHLRRPDPQPVATGTTGATGGGPAGHLAAIAQCESGGNPSAIGGGGTYRGMYQFSYETWQAVGGTGDPAAASVAEQTKRAEILYAQAGSGQWPVCGQ